MHLKFHIRLITIVIANLFFLSITAGNPTKYFEDLSMKPNYTYSYVSPTMLRVMGDTYISPQEYSNLPIKSSDITSIENIATMVNGQDDELWNIIHRIKKDKNMDTLTTKKKDNYRYDVLATLTKDGKYILNLLVVTQNGGNCVDVIYMEGKIPMERLKFSFYD